MREIKFRAWNDIDKKMVDWSTLKILPTLLVSTANNEQKHYKLMQYTGLKDKNGVEIYEGDILAKKSLYESQGFGIQVVEHEKTDINKCFGHGSFGDNAFSGFEISSYYGSPKELEVIGNIYETPELLEQSK